MNPKLNWPITRILEKQPLSNLKLAPSGFFVVAKPATSSSVARPSPWLSDANEKATGNSTSFPGAAAAAATEDLAQRRRFLATAASSSAMETATCTALPAAGAAAAGSDGNGAISASASASGAPPGCSASTMRKSGISTSSSPSWPPADSNPTGVNSVTLKSAIAASPSPRLGATAVVDSNSTTRKSGIAASSPPESLGQNSSAEAVSSSMMRKSCISKSAPPSSLRRRCKGCGKVRRPAATIGAAVAMTWAPGKAEEALFSGVSRLPSAPLRVSPSGVRASATAGCDEEAAAEGAGESAEG
mmetsp:Transcript_37395/g.79477  ORF Transcript_37395/g.79477 Transcript_37395/m.79477 type:complete len:302 (-) Transcript_37395:521-1426(-)